MNHRATSAASAIIGQAAAKNASPVKTTASYRGQSIEYAIHNRKTDTYTLIDADGHSLAEMSPAAFLSLPNRSNLEVRSGRYRAAGSKDQRGADRISGDPRRDDAADAFTYLQSGGAIAQSQQRAGASLSASITRQMLFQQSLITKLLIGGYDPVADRVMPPLKRDGVIAGEIVGYRCWRIQRGDPRALIGRLRSVYQSDVWNPGAVLEGRELGDWDSRGIHAWKDSGSKEYHHYIRSYLNSDGDAALFFFPFSDRDGGDSRPAMVTGTVFLWGDVVEHERGWRAEFARVRSLDWLYPDALMMGREAEALNDLRKLYGVVNDNESPHH